MSELLNLEQLKQVFDGDDHTYFITIKPPPDKVEAIFPLLEYIEKRLSNYWIVKCQSTKGYTHFHGIVTFTTSQTVDNKVLKALQRQVNRNMGFLNIEPLRYSIATAYDYIRDERNKGKDKFKQEDYCSKSIIDLDNI